MAYADAKIDAFAHSEFRIGQVLSKSLNVFFQNIVTFTLISATVALPFVVLSALGVDEGAAPQDKAIQAISAIVLLMFLSPLATAIILFGAFQHMRGRPVRLGDAISRGLSRFFPLVGVMFLQTIGVFLGSILLLVPGLILLAMWYVTVPACVVEKTGPIRSLGRSRQLTKGYRWKLFGLFLLTMILGLLGNVFIFVANQLAGQWGQVGAQFLWQGLIGGFGGVLIAVTYYYLRVAKEGVDVEQIASVFD